MSPFYPSLFVKIFARNVIFGHLTRANFLLIAVVGILDARHNSSLERVPLLQQFINTLRIRCLRIGEALQISRLPTRIRPRCFT